MIPYQVAPTHRWPSPTPTVGTLGSLIATFVGVAISVVLVWHASYAAFRTPAQLAGSDNSVVLRNNQPSSALWGSDTTVGPGQSESKCVTVTAPSDLPSSVKLYATDGTYTVTKSLANVLDLHIQQGILQTAGDCESFAADGAGGDVFRGTLAAFSAKDSYGQSVGTWETSGGDGESKVYRISVAINPTGTQAEIDRYQGGTASIGFTWEAQGR